MTIKPLAKRITTLTPSATVSIDARAKEFIASGKMLYNLGVGEPHLNTPECAKQAATLCIDQNKTRYDHPAGLLPLRKSLAQSLTNRYGFDLNENQITISSGAKQSVFHALMAIIDTDDEVIIPAPYWSTYSALVQLLGGVPIVLPTTAQNGWRPTLHALQQATTSHTKAILLNSPCNPTGEVYPRQWFEEIAPWIIENGLYCISDEIYGDLVYTHPNLRAPSPLDIPSLRDHTILVHGFSKGHRMTGWRIGYTACPQNIAAKLSALQSQTSHHPSMPAQYAALAALENASTSPTELCHVLLARRQLALSMINEKAKDRPMYKTLLHHPPEGAFYLFLSIHDFLESSTLSPTQPTSLQVAQDLLEKESVVLMPGEAFGVTEHLRISLAVDEEVLKEGLKRVLDYLYHL